LSIRLPTVGQEARPEVGLAALGGDPELVHPALLALDLRGVHQELLRAAAGHLDDLEVAMALDGEAGHRLAALRDALDHAPGPARLDADDDHRGDVRVRPGPDQRAEMQREVLAELQPPIGVRQGHRALDVVGDGLAGRVGQVVQRQDDHVVADADAPVGTAISHEADAIAAARALRDDGRGGRLALGHGHLTTSSS